MCEHGIEVLMISYPANSNYFTGFAGWSFYIHHGLLIALSHDYLIWFGREQESNVARLLTFLRKEDILGYPVYNIMSKLCHPMDFVSDILKERGRQSRSIGVGMKRYYFTAEVLCVLQRNLPEVSIKDGTLGGNQVRRIKITAEIAYIRQADRIAENIMGTAPQPGVRKREHCPP